MGLLILYYRELLLDARQSAHNGSEAVEPARSGYPPESKQGDRVMTAEFTIEQAYDVLLSWSKTLVRKLETHKPDYLQSPNDLPSVMEEGNDAVKRLDDAIRQGD
jgi:hypothetical protein